MRRFGASFRSCQATTDGQGHPAGCEVTTDAASWLCHCAEPRGVWAADFGRSCPAAAPSRVGRVSGISSTATACGVRASSMTISSSAVPISPPWRTTSRITDASSSGGTDPRRSSTVRRRSSAQAIVARSCATERAIKPSGLGSPRPPGRHAQVRYHRQRTRFHGVALRALTQQLAQSRRHIGHIGARQKLHRHWASLSLFDASERRSCGKGRCPNEAPDAKAVACARQSGVRRRGPYAATPLPPKRVSATVWSSRSVTDWATPANVMLAPNVKRPTCTKVHDIYGHSSSTIPWTCVPGGAWFSSDCNFRFDRWAPMLVCPT